MPRVDTPPSSICNFNSEHYEINLITHEDEDVIGCDAGIVGETTRLQLTKEILQLKMQLENLHLSQEEAKRQHELEMMKLRPEYQAAEEARRQHERNMTTLKNDHEMAVMNKKLEILQIKLKIENQRLKILQTELEIENQRTQRHNSQLQENRLARQCQEAMAQLRRVFEAERQARDELQTMREQSERILLNASLAWTWTAVACGAITGALGTTVSVGMTGAVVGAATAAAPITAAVAVISGAGWVYSKATPVSSS